jgi:predicted HicB family RNase H-like nuclease
VLETDYTENESDLTYDYMADTEFKSVNTYISAVLQDEESHQTLFYGKLKSISEEQDARGTVTVTLPEQMREGNYVLRLFLENCNANKKADYASDFVTIPVTVGTMKKTVSVESFAANERISDEDKLLFCEGQSSQHLVVSVFLILFIVAGIFACILWMYNKRKNKVSRFKKL